MFFTFKQHSLNVVNFRAPIELSPVNFQNHISSGPWVVLHHTDWCIYCKEFMPEFIEVSKSTALNLGTVDCEIHESLCIKNGVHEYPTVLQFQDGSLVRTIDTEYFRTQIETIAAKGCTSEILQIGFLIIVSFS